LKRCGVHWNEVGASNGTADIEFFNPIDASNAIKELDGKFKAFLNINLICSSENKRCEYVR